MKRVLVISLSLITLQSYIPLRIAPNVETHKITRGKKFKRSLPKRQMFIFEDPKEVNHFYRFVDKKFNLNNVNVYDDVPFNVDGEQYFFSFYEVEIPTKVLNIGAVFADALLIHSGNDTMFEDEHVRRNGHWYIALEVYSDIENDCLAKDSLFREAVFDLS